MFVRLLQGPHTVAQFDSSPELALHASYSRAKHLRTIQPQMSNWGSGVGIHEVRPTLLASPYASLSFDSDNAQLPKISDWAIELLAWLPFGLLFLALLNRTNGPDEVARLMCESNANVNSASSTQSGAQATNA
jgi:hypothetical protein